MQVGILGGGQLARMLILEAHRMGLNPHVLCANAEDPAAKVCANRFFGALDQIPTLSTFAKTVDALTVESEFLNTQVVSDSIKGKTFEPQLAVLETLQDRLTQKQLLRDFGIPTAPFCAWNHESEIKDLFATFAFGFVLKKRRFGYDGYGTFVFKKTSAKPAPVVPADKNGFIAERFIPFKRELAFSLARNGKKQFAVFPLVETKQVNSRCLWVKGPIKHRKFTALVERFQKMMNKLDYRGLLAVELFEADGQLIVNELAPRVHNSAHYSLNALTLNQFEAHWRGVLNWPLKNPEPLAKGFAMVNLLGEGGEIHLSEASLGWLHWYDKNENRLGRKLGHITVTGKSPEDALKTALKWRKGFQL
jgi:5-(carboxyamino)imidazole ribonucleotide synthase